MDSQKIVLAIADGTLSVSRIKRIALAIYDVTLEPQEIAAICNANQIETPHRAKTTDKLQNQYPDQWSIFLEALTFWVHVRRYWGDGAASDLQFAIAKSGENFRDLYRQFEAYSDCGIMARQKIELNPPIGSAIQLERLYPIELIKDLYLRAFYREFERHPEEKTGAKYPLPSADWYEFKEQKYREDCLKACDRKFPDNLSVINYFNEFWRTVYQNRGEAYFNHIKSDLVGRSDSEQRIHLYSSSEKWFRHFLRNLEGFKRNSPWRIPLDPNFPEDLPLPIFLEGLILKYGWKKVYNMAAIALVGNIFSLSEQ